VRGPKHVVRRGKTPVLTEEEASVACLYYDINEIGEMHHNPAKNVLYVRAPTEEISKRLNLPVSRMTFDSIQVT